jgi:hypothetical protein
MAARDYTSLAGVKRLGRRQLIVGFEMSTNCRFWVSTEACPPLVQPLLDNASNLCPTGWGAKKVRASKRDDVGDTGKGPNRTIAHEEPEASLGEMLRLC